MKGLGGATGARSGLGVVKMSSWGLLLSAVLMLASGLTSAAVVDQIRERIRPVGEVCVAEDACGAGLASAASASGEARDPQMVYQTFCFACHGTGANNAPVYGNQEAWEPRMARGMDALYESAINGFNNGLMPPRGLCTDCSDDEIRDTVDYLIDAL
ncbi:MAG: c-type cytochrome [Pseudomonadales bacterium]|nr:c-type cytochrome [Pseudomonadales bacterium]